MPKKKETDVRTKPAVRWPVIWMVTSDGEIPEWTKRAAQQKDLPYGTKGNVALNILKGKSKVRIGTLCRSTNRSTVIDSLMEVLIAAKTLFDFKGEVYGLNTSLQVDEGISNSSAFNKALQCGDIVVVMKMKTGMPWYMFKILW